MDLNRECADIRTRIYDVIVGFRLVKRTGVHPPIKNFHDQACKTALPRWMTNDHTIPEDCLIASRPISPAIVKLGSVFERAKKESLA
jgi:hypothetical protein